ncbi:hypothetical protein YC2023_090211 [Brassica napus]
MALVVLALFSSSTNPVPVPDPDPPFTFLSDLFVVAPPPEPSDSFLYLYLTDWSVNETWFEALKRGGFGRLIYGKCEARDSHSSSISLCIGPSLADVVLTVLEALQSAKTCRLSSLQLLLDSTVLFSAMRSWLDLIKITCFLCRKLFTLFTPLSL